MTEISKVSAKIGANEFSAEGNTYLVEKAYNDWIAMIGGKPAPAAEPSVEPVVKPIPKAKPPIAQRAAPEEEPDSVDANADAAKAIFILIHDHKKNAHVWMKKGGGFKACGPDYDEEEGETFVGVYTVESTEQEIHDDMEAVSPSIPIMGTTQSTRGEIIRVLRERPNLNAQEIWESGKFDCPMVNIYTELSLLTLRKEWLERVKLNGKYAYRVKPGVSIRAYA